MFRSLRQRIAIPYVLLILAATLGLTLYVSNQARQARLASLEAQLLADARLLADIVAPELAGAAGGAPEQSTPVDDLAKRWAALLEARVTIIAADGTVLGDSDVDYRQMENHLDRPEVRAALTSGQGTSTRYSESVGYEMMYGAYPVLERPEGRVVGAVRVALALEQVRAEVGRLWRSILTAGIVIAALAAMLALAIAQRTTKPVRELTEAAEQMALWEAPSEARSTSVGTLPAPDRPWGDRQKPPEVTGHLIPTTRDEVGQLTEAFNTMSEQLRSQMTTLAEERSRLAAVLDHMADGVIITDASGRVELINAATARLLDTTPERALGRSFAQVVGHHQLIDLWKACHDQEAEQVETVEISHPDLFLQAIVTPFAEPEAEGYLVILQDLTRIRRLETVRRDFIGNISHELRTPLAGLKALVDTLRRGAIKDPPAAKRFLKRMDGEVDTLTQLVQELLELSRLESGQAPLELAPALVSEIVVPPSERLRPQAARAGLTLSVSLPSRLPKVMADADRVQMVVTNLVHNAVKFTPPGGRVAVEARLAGEAVLVSVQDTGVGIAAADLARIFERFYKADRARSGGGTGLGLAVAKHIVQGHGGRIWAESVEGQGSTFFFTLPTAVNEQDTTP